MKKVYSIFILCILFTVYCPLSTVCFAQALSSTELINNAKQLDGRTVVYEGEVIGDIMVRGNYAWLNVNDADNAIGIWMNAALIKDIVYSGSYKSAGDIVEIVGVFHRACPEHGGDLDIHAQGLRKISSGKLFKEKLNLGKRNYALVLFAILGLIWILTLLKHK
ncbi:MAG: DNA-binding protein [Candidatus Omnitrophica bacterium]|nr:DNA-binding protein [Candidatus Omnitrophota bacterium]